MEKELFPSTVGELMEAAKAVAPDSLHVGEFLITHIATVDLASPASAHRWCFSCRSVTSHTVNTAIPIGESIDTLLAEIHCTTCGGKDTDLFPGKEREDDQPE
jgi:hypothetical protein